MSIRLIIFGFLMIASVLGLSLYWHQMQSRAPIHSVMEPKPVSLAPSVPPSPPALPAANQAEFVPDPNVTVKPKMFKSKRYPPITPEEKAMWSWYLWAKAKDPGLDWKTPIEFYGIVVDQDNNPLSDANVVWITTNMQGNGQGSTTSDSNGRFFIGNTQGNTMNVNITKQGYRSIENQQGFDLSDFTRDDFYVPDKDHPVVFHLRKLATPEAYYGWRGLIRNIADPTGLLSINGMTGEVSQGETPNSQWIQFVPGPQNQVDHPQYNIVMGTSGGNGVVLQTQNSDPVAPVAGYQNPLNTNLVLDSQGSRFLNVSTFFQDGSGNYGSTRLDIQLVRSTISLNYDIKYNPNGGKVLMFDRKNQINNPDSIHSSNY